MRSALLLLLAAAGLGLAGCSTPEGFACQTQVQYANAQTIPPLRIPDELTPPPQAGALIIPPGPDFEPREEDSNAPCLEAPPDYFDESP